MLAINMVGSRVVDRAQSLIVVVLLAVFAVFICVTIVDIDFDLLAFSGYPSLSDIISSVALTFFAYLGFSVITFSVQEDVLDPARELPKAMYLALGVTSATYVLISLGVFGKIAVDEVTGFGETAMAGAARPALGEAGFVMMAIAACRRASSVNATLYASGGLTAMLAKVGRSLVFRRESPLGGHAGLLIASGLVIVVANIVDLSAIASVGSACSLMMFLLVGIAGYRRRHEVGATRRSCWRRSRVTAVMLVFFAVDTLGNAPETFMAIVAIGCCRSSSTSIWKRRAPAPAAITPGRS